MRFLRAARVALATTLVFGVSGACGRGVTDSETDLATARAHWAERAPSAYTITISRSCECLREMSGPVTVSVRNGVVESRQYVESGGAVAAQYANAFPAVEGLFALIDAGVRAGSRPITARYDPALGYPTRFAIGDPATDAPLYTVSEFRPR